MFFHETKRKIRSWMIIDETNDWSCALTIHRTNWLVRSWMVNGLAIKRMSHQDGKKSVNLFVWFDLGFLWLKRTIKKDDCIWMKHLKDRILEEHQGSKQLDMMLVYRENHMEYMTMDGVNETNYWFFCV